MQKNYLLNKTVVFSFLLVLSLNFTVSAQSRSGKNTRQQSNFSRLAAVENSSRTTSPTHPVTQATTTITECGSYTWPENGQTYTTSGIYTSGGGITQLFSDQTDWNDSAVANGATVSTNNLAGIPSTATINLTMGSVNVTMSAPSGMFSNGSLVGANNPNQNITITFSPGVYGVSGNYFGADLSSNILSGTITATYSDAVTDSRTVTTDTESFGYFAVTPITSVVLSSSTVGRYISLKNLSIATNPTSTTILDLTINPVIDPIFTPVNPICLGDTLLPLPTTSNNGVPGSWSPALDPTNTTTYTFTPAVNECASTKTMTIIVNPASAYTNTVAACSTYTWPVNGATYTTTGAYTASIGLTDTQEIDDLSSWINHAYSFNSTIVGDAMTSHNSGSQIVVPFGPVNATLTAPGGMYSSGDFVGTLNPNNTLTINFSTPVYGVSGQYFTTDLNDNTISGNVTVTYFNNNHIQTRTVTTDTERFGYFDNNLISKIEISTSTTIPDRYIAIKNLVVASNPHSCSTETLDLTINSAPAPGDTYATAIDVVGTNYTTTGNNLEVNCYTDTGGELSPDVWYKVTLDPCATNLSVDTCTGSNFDTIITVFAADGITELAYSDDDCPDANSFQSAVNDLDITGQGVVYIMVEGYYGLNNEQGTFGLNVTQTLLSQTVTTFDPVAAICSGDTLAPLPTTSTNGIPGTWAPALDNTTTTTYTFTPNADQCATTASLTITVNQPITPTFNPVAAICNGDTLLALPTTSVNSYNGTWAPALDNTATTTYTFTPTTGQCATTASLTINVNQPITPTFNPVAAICNGDTLSALPTTSVNSYNGTWAPALDNTATTTYTFTPTTGQCATTASLTINVNQPITPTFNPVMAICNGDTLSALPTTSVNSYNGTWAPALDNTATTTYTFTPTTGQCATTASLTINVNQKITPTFNPVAAICNGDTLSALPTTSVNSYNGTWAPALDNTATTTYTFTPTNGQCATTTSLTITVNQPITPTFNPVAAICNGDTLSALPTTSVNAYNGTWSPALDNTATTTYTFTPTTGQCATTASLTITVNQKITPTFNPVAAICNGDTLSALPTTSVNAYNGTWAPALDNTATTTYTFTPTNGQCATTASLTINVNQKITPTFNPVAAICNGDTLTALPTTSVNAYNGTWSPALDNTTTTTYTFTPTTGQCATTASLTINVNQKITPTFNPVAAICNGDTLSALPTTSVNSYNGTWAPALDNTATTTYTFTPTTGQCATTASLTINVNQPITPTFNPVAAICNGDTLSALPTTSVNAYNGTWAPALDNTATTTYTFTPTNGQCATTTSLTITVNQPITPTFNPVAAICNGDTLTALPTTSVNSYNGTWAPALDNTTTTTYTFTPTTGQCATTASLTITVNQPVASTFAAIAAICKGDALVLPSSSANGISGTWLPAVDTTETTTYTFTPNNGECATTASLTVTVNQPVLPTFTAVPAICNGDTLAALPTTSNNNINGTWSPALDNTVTTTYTFTPNTGECALTTTLTITVNQPITPIFNPVAAICNGDTLTALPTTSINTFSGSWSPALDNTVTTTYTFTPDSGQCAAVTTLTITVNQPTMPTFSPVNPICTGASLTPLPTTSIDGYVGSWSPALDNTATTTYTFTPNSGQCAVTTALTITVNTQLVTPLFNPVAAICNGATLAALPTTSTNNYTGSWSPALDNTTTTTYTFTPDPGQCGDTTTLTITVNQPLTSTFTPIAAICNGDNLVLPSSSTNGISGTWSPAIDNTATTTYTFTPNTDQCGTTTTMTVIVNQPITPTFNPVAAICNGATLSALPTTSINSITGSWSPALDNTATTTYTFTPNTGQCATTALLTITVNQPIAPTFNPVAAICNGDTLSALPITSINSITGSWSPALDNTATTTYTFTPNTGQCATTASLTITVHTTAMPTGNSFQAFNVTDLNDATIADLVVNPSDVNWYGSLADAQSLNNPPLPLSTVLTTGATYYAVAFSATCPSQPFPVTVTVTLDNSEFDNLHFNYYPNPTSSVLNITYSKIIEKVTLINMLGQTISTEKTNSTEVTMDLSRLAEATYFVKVESDGKQKIIKVVKTR